MIITRLTLHNFGIYAGTNTFHFHGDKPIVLIGGLNGRGKTTFLEAILLSLYGVNSFAYKESSYAAYGQYLRSFVNENDGTKETYIEIEFQMLEEGDEYIVRRDWAATTKKKTTETISVYQNGEASEFLAQNWPMFIENILPSALSNFFFFDGEKIAELAVDNTDTQMKESIRAMLGLSMLDVLHNDLNRIIGRNRKKLDQTTDAGRISLLRQERDEAQARVTEIEKQIETLEIEKKKKKAQLEKARVNYTAKGGDIVEKRQELFTRRSLVIAQLEQNGNDLLGAAATALPLTLVADLLMTIKDEGYREHNIKIEMQAAQKINELFDQYRKVHGEDASEFLAFANERLVGNETQPIFNLSDASLYQVTELCTASLEHCREHTRSLQNHRKDLQEKADEFDRYLSVDINENEIQALYKRIKTLEQEIIDCETTLASLTKQKGVLSYELVRKNAEFTRNVTAALTVMEAKDDADRTAKYANLAEMVLKEYSLRLQRNKVGKLADVITECYKLLANKKTLIDRVSMDLDTLDLYYINQDGGNVPKAKLSAGEKQLMVISILWALAKCSQKKLPVIIDTPLSRLDSAHRTALITTYFPQASEQTIILSTDTEIDETYYRMMKPNIGDEFCLEYDETTKSTSIREGYFA